MYFQIEKENYQAQLQSLKSQVSPHFLFNNLDALASIIPVDPEKVLEYTHNLSHLYCYYFEIGQEDLISLKEELINLEAYQFYFYDLFVRAINDHTSLNY